MRLLSSVRSDMSRLMFEAVKGLFTQRALVWAREILSVFGRRRHASHDLRNVHGRDGSSHAASLRVASCLELRARRRLWVQQIRKIYRRGSALHVTAVPEE